MVSLIPPPSSMLDTLFFVAEEIELTANEQKSISTKTWSKSIASKEDCARRNDNTNQPIPN